MWEAFLERYLGRDEQQPRARREAEDAGGGEDIERDRVELAEPANREATLPPSGEGPL